MRRKKPNFVNTLRGWRNVDISALINDFRDRIVRLRAWPKLAKFVPIYRMLVASVGMVFFFSLVAPLGLQRQASAYSTRTQDDWSGGVGAASNQYAAVENVNAGSSLTLGSSVNDWCDTAHCDSNWTKRQVVRFNYLGEGSQALNFMPIKVTYKASMQADFDDLRFVSADNATELPFYIGTKTNSSYALAYVNIGSVQDQLLEVNMYYGNASATSLSDSSQMLVTDQFLQSSTTTSTITSWNSPNYPSGIATDSSNNVYVASSQGGQVIKYSSTGTQLATFGSGGTGPGQFNVPSERRPRS